MPSERIRTSIPTEFRAGPMRAQGKIRNVSEGGLFVGTASIPEEGEMVDLALRTPKGHPVHLQGFVWWTTRADPSGHHHKPGFGLRLLDEESEGMRRLLDSL